MIGGWIDKIKGWLGMKDDHNIKVPIEGASDRQILLALFYGVTRMEKKMSDLTDAVGALTTAVSGLSGKIGERVDALNASLAEAQQALSDFTLADDLEDAAYVQQITDLQTALDSALGDASTAVAGIQGAVAAIQQVTDAADESPETPVDPVDPNDLPHPDQTLPGDLPEDGGEDPHVEHH